MKNVFYKNIFFFSGNLIFVILSWFYPIVLIIKSVGKYFVKSTNYYAPGTWMDSVKIHYKRDLLFSNCF